MARKARGMLRSFAARLAAIALLALALRLLYALRYAPDLSWGDGKTYHWLANLLADGHGFIGSHQYVLEGDVEPTAEHPPLYPLVLAAVSKVGLTSWTAHRLVSVALGVATVVAIGFLGRRVGGELIGLLAAAIAALYPLLIMPEGMVGSEALYGLMVGLVLLAAYAFLDRPSPRRAIGLGAAIGLAVLTRGEAVLFVPLLALPLTLRRGTRSWRNAAIACVVAAVVVAPWTIRNWVVFDRPVLATTVGGLLGGANCDRMWHGALTGLWLPSCQTPPPPGADDAARAAHWQRQGIDYAQDHASRFPAVAAVRVLRLWDLYKPQQGAAYERAAHGRHFRIQRLGQRIYYVLLALALLGAVVLRRRGATLLPLVVPFVMVTVTAALMYGIPKYRLAAEIPIVVLAAAGVVALRDWVGPVIVRRAR